jgi:uncharacterized protein (UPF0264 family)
VALGDAPHLPGTLALAAAGAVSCGADFVKVGLLGSSRPDQALEMLAAITAAARGARLVAVAYADAARAGGLPPAALPRIAARAGAHGVMIDTAIKDGASSFDALGESVLARFVEEARSLGLMAALAGSLGAEDLDRARSLGCDVVGVRGSACDGGRAGTVSVARVRALARALDPAMQQPLTVE